jgi:uncharacterized membrane protein
LLGKPADGDGGGGDNTALIIGVAVAVPVAVALVLVIIIAALVVGWVRRRRLLEGRAQAVNFDNAPDHDSRL